MKKKYTEYTITGRKGMGGRGDYITEWMSVKEINKIILEDKKYIEELKANGTYGDIYTMSLKIEHDSMYDVSQKGKSCESYRFHILDLNKF